MKKIYLIVLVFAALATIAAMDVDAQDYQGTESCAMCHSRPLGSYPGYTKFTETLHTKIHLLPSVTTMIGDYTKEVDMGMRK